MPTRLRTTTARPTPFAPPSIELREPHDEAAATLPVCPTDVRTLARVLAGGSPHVRHVDAAHRVLARVGGLRGLSRAGRARLVEHGGLGEEHVETLLAALALARAVQASRAASVLAERFRSPESIGRWAAPRIGALEHEEVWVLVFGVKQQLLAARRVFRGGVHTVPVHLPSLLREVIAEGGTRFAIVHNHPSGDPTPSPEDVAITERIARAAATLDVPLVEHVIVTARAWACVPFSIPSAAPLR
jgi:DNA repair protein RadC